MKTTRSLLTPALLIAAMAFSSGRVAFAEPGAAALPAVVAAESGGRMSASAWGPKVWDAAQNGEYREFDRLLALVQSGGVADASTELRSAVEEYLGGLAKREAERGEQLTKAREAMGVLLDEIAAGESGNVSKVAKALREAIAIQSLLGESTRVLREARVPELVQTAHELAKKIEVDGNAMDATELYLLLDQLNDVSGKFRPDLRRNIMRQEMLRLYVPQRLWELTNERRVREGLKGLAAYNSLGGDYREKLAPITQDLVEVSISRAQDHVEGVATRVMLRGGLDAVKTLVTTRDLSLAFEGLKDERARADFLATLEKERGAIERAAEEPDRFVFGAMLDRVLRKNDQTVKVPTRAILHEFGNGAMGKLDEYSVIIWPDEVARFRKNTEGRFVGVGVQIEFDELQNVRVVTPLEGTPAQRAGVHPGDLITKIDGKSIVGLSLDQVVDVITGREGTVVVMTVERAIDEDEDSPAGEEQVEAGAGLSESEREELGKAQPREELEFMLTRATIEVPSVKGWMREGAREDAWDWFIDREAGIGYVRVSQFADTTTSELDRAVAQMRREGLKGLIFDLRFNPGGLLDQAVSVAQRFLPFDGEPIVSARRAGDLVVNEGATKASKASLATIPVIVLVNEGSASASEIVSGAVSVYSQRHALDAMVLGSRTFGKGSVQNVWPLGRDAQLKLTTAYYMIPDGTILHRRPGDTAWGVEPNLSVEMLLSQTSKALSIRRNADIMPLDENGVIVRPRTARGEEESSDPADLLKGLDLQLEAAKLVLHARLQDDDGAKLAGDAGQGQRATKPDGRGSTIDER
jgi:carboxyl-terminal processing protease